MKNEGKGAAAPETLGCDACKKNLTEAEINTIASFDCQRAWICNECGEGDPENHSKHNEVDDEDDDSEYDEFWRYLDEDEIATLTCEDCGTDALDGGTRHMDDTPDGAVLCAGCHSDCLKAAAAFDCAGEA